MAVFKSNLPSRRQEAEVGSYLDQLGNRAWTGAEVFFDIIDAPARYTLRPILAGKWPDKIGEPATSAEMLQNLGLRPHKNSLGGWGRPVAEFIGGAIADPLNAVTFGGLSAAGKVVKAAGKLDDVGRIAGRKYLDDVLERAVPKSELTGYSKNALNTLERAGKAPGFGGKSEVYSAPDKFMDALKNKTITDDDLITRGVVGRRQAGRSTTFDDILQDMTADRKKASEIGSWDEIPEELRNAFLGTKQESDKLLKKFQGLGDQSIRKDMGIGIPFFEDSTLFGMNLPGGEAVARNLDRAGQFLRWSAPGRGAAAWFSNANMGQTDELGQIFGQQIHRAAKEGTRTGKDEFSELIRELSKRDFDVELSPKVRSAIEEGKDGLPGASPELDEFVRAFPKYREEMARLRADRGLDSGQLENYFPRQATEGVFSKDYIRQMKGGATQVGTPDMISRKDYLENIRGGTKTINDLSLEQDSTGKYLVSGKNRAYKTDEEAGEYIRGKILNKEGKKISKEDGIKIARTLYRIEDAALENKVPLFGNHWLKDLEQYATGNRRSIAVADKIQEILGSSAVPTKYTQLDASDGRYEAASKVLSNMGLKSFKDSEGEMIGGITNFLKSAGTFGKKAPIRNFSISEHTANALKKIDDKLRTPEAAHFLIDKFLDPLINAWKGSILTWPARFTRDWLSGVAVNAVEVDNAIHLFDGYRAQNALMHAGTDFTEFRKIMGRAPRYRNIIDEREFERLVQKDLANSGILENTRSADLQTRFVRAGSGEEIENIYRAGLEKRPTFLSSALRGGKDLGETAAAKHLAPMLRGKGVKDILKTGLPTPFKVFGSPDNVKSPLLSWSAELGNNTDAINRGAGYFALLLSGVDPNEAGRRMLKAHVDYGSLTGAESQIIKRILPFWAYSSRIGAWVAEKIFEHPGGRYTQLMMRAPQEFMENNDQEYIPSSIRSSYGIQIGKEGDVNKWISDIDLPGIDTLNYFEPVYAPGQTLPSLTGSTQALFGNIASQGNPLLKTGYEFATGIDSYTGRRRGERPNVMQQVYEKTFGGSRYDPYGTGLGALDYAAQYLPFAPRALQTANKLLDSERTPDLVERVRDTGFTAFSGVKPRNFLDSEAEADLQRRVRQMLGDDPMVREIESQYVPEDAKPFLNPETQRLLDLSRMLDRRRRERYAASR